MQRHPGVFIGAGAVVALMVGGVAFAVWRSHKREELPQKAKRLRIAMRRAVDDPKKVARGDAPVWEKIIAAVGTTIAVNLTKKLVDKAWSSTQPARR